MKIAIIHLSDFHIRENDSFSSQKINGLLSALNAIGEVDDYIIVFSGDLSFSGKPNEYKCSRYIFGKLIAGIKEKNNNNFVDLYMVPGNHDLCLPLNPRDRQSIQDSYDKGQIEQLLPTEISYLGNYYKYSNASGIILYDKLLNRRYRNFGDYKIQFNLINTAPFSTLEPNDKELHYFPSDKMPLLKKADDANLCITVMHHSYEWFNWSCKSYLEKSIVDNSEMLFIGHDHREGTGDVSIDNSLDTWISAAGEMKFSKVNEVDSFNVIVLDTADNSFTGYIFTWDEKNKLYIHKTAVENRHIQNHTSELAPLPSFLKSIREDAFNASSDFTKYFVFPKLETDYKNKFGKYDEVKTVEELIETILEKKKILITGASNAGKTTLLKYLYCSLIGKKVPLLLAIDSHTKIKHNKFVKRLFEDQYGDNSVLFERFGQLEKDKRILIIDGWDSLDPKQNKSSLLKQIEDTFGYVVISVNSNKRNIVDDIKETVYSQNSFCELHIKPFFSEKRSELVRNICVQKNAFNDEDINNVNRLIDSLVHNNSGLFSLNPAFIIRYTNFFILSPYHDYAKGEAVFSKIFEFELQQSIIKLSKRADVDEIFIAFEEIAGYMYSTRQDILKLEDVRFVIDTYNANYGVSVNVKTIVEIGIRAKILKQDDSMSIYYANKNHLAYFIAKYLIRCSQNDPNATQGIQYAIKNICFGINADIILFISYLLNSTQSIMSILAEAGELLSPWDEVNLEKKNISILSMSTVPQIAPPTAVEQEEYKEQVERSEESQYSEDTVEGLGLFEYNDEDINKYPYRLIRAIKYTEILCKALPAFNSSLKLQQKQVIINSIYSYPRKIVYALLRPYDTHFDDICDDLLAFTAERRITKENGSPYTREDFRELLNDNARATMLSLFDHFAEMCTSMKTMRLLVDRKPEEISEQLERLLVIENTGNTEVFIKEAEAIMKGNSDPNIQLMVQLIARKHLFCNKNLSFNQKQKLIDKIFGKGMRKVYLAASM